jgi:hypothetical protein
VGQKSTTKSATGWVSTSLTGINYAKASTASLTVTK